MPIVKQLTAHIRYWYYVINHAFTVSFRVLCARLHWFGGILDISTLMDLSSGTPNSDEHACDKVQKYEVLMKVCRL
jgi:hypothetical protein